MSFYFLAVWLGHTFVAASLLMLMTLALMTLLRQPASRQRLGELGLALALLTMPLCLFGPRLWSIDWSSRHQPMELPVALDSGEWGAEEAEIAGLEPWGERAPVAAASVPATLPGATWRDWFDVGLKVALIAYGAGVVFFLGRWLVGLLGLWRLTRNATPAEPEIVEEVLRHWPEQSLPRILRSPQLNTPISFGVIRPTIILPDDRAATPAEREWMLTHELTHLERRDAWSMQLLLLAQAIFYPMPWCSWLRRQVRLCQEYVADAAAARVPVARNQSVEDYAEFLVRLASSQLASSRCAASRSTAPQCVSSLVSGVTSSDLTRRVTMLLEQHPRFEKRGLSWKLLSAGCALAAVAVLSSGVRAQDRIEIKPNVQVVIEPQAAIAVPAVKAVQVQQADEKDVLFLRQELGEAIGQALLATGGNPKAVAALERILKQLDGPADELDLKELRQDLRKALADLKALRVQPIPGVPAVPAQVVPFAVPFPPVPPMAPLPPLPPAAGFKFQIVTPDGPFIPENVQDLIQKMLKDGKVDADALSKEIDKARDLAKKAAEDAKQFQLEIEAAPFALQGKLFAARPGGGLFKMAGVRGRLGLVVDPVNDVLAEQLDLPKQRGLVVGVVVPDSPAAKAGIKVNDILLKLNDQDLSNEPEAFAKLIAGLSADKEFSLVLRRRGKVETVSGLKIAAPAFTAATPGLFQRDALSITTQRTNDNFTTRCHEGGTSIVVTGLVKDNQPQVSRITIEEAGKSESYDSIDRVPEKHRPRVSQLVELNKK